MNLKEYFIKYIDSFEYLEHLILYMLSLIIVISSVLAFEMIIFIFHFSISMRLISFYILILFVLSILALFTLFLFIYSFSNFYKTGGDL